MVYIKDFSLIHVGNTAYSIKKKKQHPWDLIYFEHSLILLVDMTTIIVASVFGVLLCGGVIAAVFFYRKQQFEAALNAGNWKVDFNDIVFIKDKVVREYLSFHFRLF